MTLEEKENEARAKLQGVAKQIKSMLPEDFGFVLLCAAYGEGGNGAATLYVANVRRLDALQMMREFIAVNVEKSNFAEEMPKSKRDAEFEAFWAGQKERNPPEDLERWCWDAFSAGRASVYVPLRNVPPGSGKTEL
jgi:hypothetical protein